MFNLNFRKQMLINYNFLQGCADKGQKVVACFYPGVAPEPEPPRQRLFSIEMIFQSHTVFGTRKLPAVCANDYMLINGPHFGFAGAGTLQWVRGSFSSHITPLAAPLLLRCSLPAVLALAAHAGPHSNNSCQFEQPLFLYGRTDIMTLRRR